MDAFLGICSAMSQAFALPLCAVCVMLKMVNTADRQPVISSGCLSSLLSIGDAFNPETAPIWDTQMPALQMIMAAGARGVVLPALERVFLRCKTRFPEIYEDSTVEEWIEFCRKLDLIDVRDGRVRMSTEGAIFMQNRVDGEVVCICA